MIELIHKGGIMMYPLILSSVIALAVIAERIYIFFVKTKHLKESVLTEALGLVKEKRLEEARTLMRSQDSVFKSIYLSLLTEPAAEDREESAINCGDNIIFSLAERLNVLSILGTITPLLGLLGTVIGMIRVFSRVARAGDAADITILAGGIWEALITTAVGMGIAIPVLIAYHCFNQQIESIGHKNQDWSCRLLSTLKKNEAPS